MKLLQRICSLLFFSLFLVLRPVAAIGQATLTVHLRGVSESKISLLPLAGPKAYRPILEISSIKRGEVATLAIPPEYLPGEFVLRFDYKEKPESTPYPCEKPIIFGNQPLTLWLNPMYCNSADSSKFQPGELENVALRRFQAELGPRMQKIGLLQQFLMEYDITQSDFYRQGITEYERRRTDFNAWIGQQVSKDSVLFASSTYRFYYLPQVNFSGSERERLLNLIEGYFEGIDLSDPKIIRTSQMNEWMNAWVNLHGQMATSIPLRDSLIPAAAYKAIEKAKAGHPQVYGWMVDYFYRGFESNNIPQGMKVLQPYLDDPVCLTNKRMEIERRLKGMESLVPGVQAPDFTLNEKDNEVFILSSFKSSNPHILLLFWSADCGHCIDEIDKLYPLLQQIDEGMRPAVIAISLDENETELKAWKHKTGSLPAWKHLNAKEGINSKVANDYFILATPVMVLIDSKTRTVLSIPSNTEELKKYLL